VLTGHGSFSEYLHEKAKYEIKTKCYHCAKVRNTFRTSWRYVLGCAAPDVLGQIVGDDLSLPAAVKA